MVLEETSKSMASAIEKCVKRSDYVTLNRYVCWAGCFSVEFTPAVIWAVGDLIEENDGAVTRTKD